MDWQLVKSIICDGRGFSVDGNTCQVLADTLMPSGALIHIHLQAKTDHLMAHDGGGAFDELSRHAVDIRSLRGVRAMLSEVGFKVSDSGVIYRDRFPVEKAHDAICLTADASFRAASFMLAHGKVSGNVPLDRKLQDAMRARFPHGHANFTFAGKHRQHKFDFGFEDHGKTVLLQSVNPEQSSISSAIVKGLDATASGESNVVPIFVFDPADEWSSGSLNMLALGGRQVEIGAIQRGELLAA